MKISVLMPVFNTPLPWLKQAFDSIATQSYTDFNMVVVDDHNMDPGIMEYIYGPIDKCCITVVRTEKNQGLAAALDFGMGHCSGELIIRMDSDDIAHVDLVKKHFEFFTQHPEASVCGVQIKLFSDSGSWESHHPLIVSKELAYKIPGYWFVNHPGVAFRKDVIQELGGYGQTPSHLPEDYALWIKVLKSGRIIFNRPEVLVDYRVHPSTLQKRRSNEWVSFLFHQKQSLYV